MQKWVRCNVPLIRQADVFGASNRTLFGKIDSQTRSGTVKQSSLHAKVSWIVVKGGIPGRLRRHQW